MFYHFRKSNIWKCNILWKIVFIRLSLRWYRFDLIWLSRTFQLNKTQIYFSGNWIGFSVLMDLIVVIPRKHLPTHQNTDYLAQLHPFSRHAIWGPVNLYQYSRANMFCLVPSLYQLSRAQFIHHTFLFSETRGLRMLKVRLVYQYLQNIWISLANKEVHSRYLFAYLISLNDWRFIYITLNDWSVDELAQNLKLKFHWYLELKKYLTKAHFWAREIVVSGHVY